MITSTADPNTASPAPAVPLRELDTPEVKDFVNARAYLVAIYEWRSSRSRGFSYARWARELGFQSRSFLRMVVMGRRSITENSIALFIRGLKLSKSDAEYFAAMVRLTQAEGLAAREYYAEELARLRRQRRASPSQVVHDHFRFLSSHHGPRVQTLLTLQDLSKTPAVLARLLGITESAVQEILETLTRLGLARQDAPGPGGEPRWAATTSTFEVKTALGDIALQAFHRKSLEEAGRALDLDSSQRHYHSLLMPLSPSEYKDLVEELRRTAEEFLIRHQSDVGRSRRLYQLNFNLIPVSQPISWLETIGEAQ